MRYNFEEAVRKDSLHHAFIIEAPSNIDKIKYVKEVTKIILKFIEESDYRRIEEENHPDIYIVKAEKDVVKVEQIRELQKQLSRLPLEANKNIGIIVNGDKLNLNGYNRLLKTIEEPSSSSIIFILSENIMNIPITVRSRCIKISINEEKYKLSKENKSYNKAKEFFTLVKNREYFYKKKSFVEENVKDRESAQIILDDLEKIYRDLLMGESEIETNISNSEIFNAISLIEEGKNQLKYNIKPTVVLKKLSLVIGG